MSTPWHQAAFYSFDLETTGVDPSVDRVVTAAFTYVDPASGDVRPTTWLADPGCDIPEQAAQVHGITTEYARTHGRPAADVVTEISAALLSAWERGYHVVVYNAPYDLSLLDREMRRHLGHGIDQTPGPVIDPLVIDRAQDKYRRGSRKLVDVAEHYGVPLDDESAHGAAADALAAARVAWVQTQRYPEVRDMSLADLQQAQSAWYRDWALGFREFLVEKMTADGEPQKEIDAVPERVPTEWPLRPVSAPVAAR